eukprot:CAMPEP_0181302070 /NCGR_PEP_ID=MMETSP1101-20121128/7769_1 /TAXON_ID=46948 /ORGANISM="Rhodomonas abbreviata, Strain Caron Lab Isolate" /LENGTH=236 /DNA_ID=CAMNT_0023407433 /DNA_START=50 /DNA_END=760 /DNA_ORIENTATION=+
MEMDMDSFVNEVSTPARPDENFRYAVVMDFEATCFQSAPGEKSRIPQEIIEFPAVIIDLAGGKDDPPLAEFQRYVQPTEIPALSDFCTELTGITQGMVAGQATIDHVVKEFVQWIGSQPYLNTSQEGCNFVICTCGDWDFNTMFPTEMNRKGFKKLVPAWLGRRGWCNVKDYYQDSTGMKGGGMVKILNNLQLPLIGRHHSGIDDTRNIARILQKVCVVWGDPVVITKYPQPDAWV